MGEIYTLNELLSTGSAYDMICHTCQKPCKFQPMVIGMGRELNNRLKKHSLSSVINVSITEPPLITGFRHLYILVPFPDCVRAQ